MNPETLELLSRYMAVKAKMTMLNSELEQCQNELLKLSAVDINCRNKRSSLNKRIEEIKKEMNLSEEIKRAVDRALAMIKSSVSDSQYQVFYFHYVKGMSLSKTAKKIGYSKAGVVKICAKIRRKI